jgi:hypothetical protein
MSSLHTRQTTEISNPERYTKLIDDQLKWEDSENPFARISCRARGNCTICEWVCRECKIKRIQYETYFISKWLRDEEIASSWDPDFHINDADHYREILKAKITLWNQRKLEIIAKRNNTAQENRIGDIVPWIHGSWFVAKKRFTLLSDSLATHIDTIH